MSISIKYINIPDNYNFSVKINIYSSTLLYDLYNYYDFNNILIHNNNINAIPNTGLFENELLSFFVHNQEKQGFITLFFTNKLKFEELLNAIEIKKKNKIKTIKNPLYRYCNNYNTWNLVDKYTTKDANKDIFGYNNYIESISKDIDNHIKYNKFLTSLGEVKSINYMLYGPPGTGKTSLIKAIANLKELPIFIVNPSSLDLGNIKKVLSPKTETTSPLKILLFEDFDRFLQNDKINDAMSQILNSLDGLDDEGNIIRFFTANNYEVIMNNHALINRMSSIFKFNMPNINILRAKLLRLLSFYESYDENKVEKFLSLVEKYKVNSKTPITVRSFVNYVIRYLFDENYLDEMIKHIDEL